MLFICWEEVRQDTSYLQGHFAYFRTLKFLHHIFRGILHIFGLWNFHSSSEAVCIFRNFLASSRAIWLVICAGFWEASEGHLCRLLEVRISISSESHISLRKMSAFCQISELWQKHSSSQAYMWLWRYLPGHRKMEILTSCTRSNQHCRRFHYHIPRRACCQVTPGLAKIPCVVVDNTPSPRDRDVTAQPIT